MKIYFIPKTTKIGIIFVFFRRQNGNNMEYIKVSEEAADAFDDYAKTGSAEAMTISVGEAVVARLREILSSLQMT